MQEKRQSKYINPYTDFGFKKLFGEEANKDLLTDFLNQLLPEHHKIAELQFDNPGVLSGNNTERKAFFDIFCTSVTGERFVVEMQKEKFKNFKNRALYYTTYPIKEQAMRGQWAFKLSAIYFIAILDFFYDEDKEKAKLRRDVMLKDQDCEPFSDKLHFKFIQMPAFTKEEHELETQFDKWLYFLKKLPDFNEIPRILNEPIFQKAFKTAELANMTPEERKAYEISEMNYAEVRGVVDTAIEQGIEQGIEKGIEQGKVVMIIALHEDGHSDEYIAKIAQMPIEKVREIIENYKSVDRT